MQKLLAVLTIVVFTVGLVGCGGETPQPTTPVAEPDLGAAGAIDTMESGSGTGASGALPPSVDTPPATEPTGEQPAAEGEPAATDGPALPDANK